MFTEVVTAAPAVSVAGVDDVVGLEMEKSLGWARTVRVKLWLAGLPAPVAVMVMGYDELDPMAGVPARVAVPSPLSVSLTPLGSAPASVMAGAGVPDVVTVNVPAVPWVKVVVADEVTAAAVLTVRVKDVVWVAPVPVPVTVTV